MIDIDDFIIVNEAERGSAFAAELFQRKYKLQPPENPHHVIAYFREDDGRFSVACYVHFTDCGEILLGGGACTDDRVLRRMSIKQRDCVRAAGGLYQHTLKWAQRHFSERFSAIFGYCGDVLAERVDRAAGFESTCHKHLLVYWTRKLEEPLRARMVAKAHTFVPF